MPKTSEQFEHYMDRVGANWESWLCRSVCPYCIARENCQRRRDVIVQRPKLDYDKICADNVGDGSV